jgi:hypothetical protein
VATERVFGGSRSMNGGRSRAYAHESSRRGIENIAVKTVCVAQVIFELRLARDVCFMPALDT